MVAGRLDPLNIRKLFNPGDSFFKSAPSTDQVLPSELQYKLEDSRKSNIFSHKLTSTLLLKQMQWGLPFMILILLYTFNYNQTLGKILYFLHFIKWAIFFKSGLSHVRVGYFKMSQRLKKFLMKWPTILLQCVRTRMFVLVPYEVIVRP